MNLLTLALLGGGAYLLLKPKSREDTLIDLGVTAQRMIDAAKHGPILTTPYEFTPAELAAVEGSLRKPPFTFVEIQAVREAKGIQYHLKYSGATAR